MFSLRFQRRTASALASNLLGSELLPRTARQFADFGDAGRAARGEAGGAVVAMRVTQNQIVDGFQRLSYLVECGFRALEVQPWPS